MRPQLGTRAWVRRRQSSRDGKVQGFQKSALKMGISACSLIGRHDGVSSEQGGSMVAEGTVWQWHGVGDAASQLRASQERPVVLGARPGGQVSG